LFVNFCGANLTAAVLDAATRSSPSPCRTACPCRSGGLPTPALRAPALAGRWSGEASQRTVSLSYEVGHPASYFDGEMALLIDTGGRRMMDCLRRYVEEPPPVVSLLYSLWVATSECEASRNFVAVGSPGIGGDTDTRGSCA
jgi:hypothetical protein